MIAALVFLGACVVALVLTFGVRRYAVRHGVVDTPNHRSSHGAATPRGGGLAIAVTVLLGMVLLAWAGKLHISEATAFIGAGVLVAAIGFLDDHRHVPAVWRLIVHFLAAAWLVAVIVPELALVLQVLCAIAIVWLLNLYNFMDGIDGIAGIEALTVCLAIWGLTAVTNAQGQSIEILLLAGSCLGFLFLNFPTARIFMGDVGSGFVGILLGAFVLKAMSISVDLLWVWVIMLGAFVVDASVTLLQRIRRRQRIHEAHRSHAYQILARRFGGHIVVSMAIGAVNILWLLPMSALVLLTDYPAPVLTTIALGPLVAFAYYVGAGAQDD